MRRGVGVGDDYPTAADVDGAEQTVESIVVDDDLSEEVAAFRVLQHRRTADRIVRRGRHEEVTAERRADAETETKSLDTVGDDVVVILYRPASNQIAARLDAEDPAVDGNVETTAPVAAGRTLRRRRVEDVEFARPDQSVGVVDVDVGAAIGRANDEEFVVDRSQSANRPSTAVGNRVDQRRTMEIRVDCKLKINFPISTT